MTESENRQARVLCETLGVDVRSKNDDDVESVAREIESDAELAAMAARVAFRNALILTIQSLPAAAKKALRDRISASLPSKQADVPFPPAKVCTTVW